MLKLILHRISDISAGRDHLLILTSAGRVHAAAASHNYPDKGQLGVPGLTWATRPKDRPYDSPFPIATVGNIKIDQIATGNYHSVLLDSKGGVWTFGDNSSGQLGFDYSPDQPIRDSPTKLLLQGFYPSGIAATCYQIAAGGMNSFYMLDAAQLQDGKVTADVWASGLGLWGELGNGKWTHVQGKPTKIKTLSGLIECETMPPFEMSTLPDLNVKTMILRTKPSPSGLLTLPLEHITSQLFLT